jgi:hypothetical protein
MAAGTKFTPELSARAAGVGDDQPLDVVIELGHEGDVAAGRGSIDVRRDAFEQEARPLQQAVVAAGGQVLATAWLNRTLKARVPKGSLRALSELQMVKALDVPHGLRPDRG